MRKITKTQFATIATLTTQSIVQYYNTFVKNAASVNAMYVEDIAYNYAALNAFKLTQDVQALYSTLMQQDTLVREFFINTLVYCEDSKLVNVNYATIY